MRHIHFVFVCILGLLLSVPASATIPVEEPPAQLVQDGAEFGPYGDPGG